MNVRAKLRWMEYKLPVNVVGVVQMGAAVEDFLKFQDARIRMVPQLLTTLIKVNVTHVQVHETHCTNLTSGLTSYLAHHLQFSPDINTRHCLSSAPHDIHYDQKFTQSHWKKMHEEG